MSTHAFIDIHEFKHKPVSELVEYIEKKYPLFEIVVKGPGEGHIEHVKDKVMVRTDQNGKVLEVSNPL